MQSNQNRITPPLPKREKEYKIIKPIDAEQIIPRRINGGYDKHGVKYSFRDDALNIDIPDINQDYNYLLGAIKEYSNNIRKVIIGFDSFNMFNNICKVLSNNNLNIDIILDISGILKEKYLKKRTLLNFESLPNNIKVSYLSLPQGMESQCLSSFNQTQFEEWALWLNEADYENVIKKLTPNSRKRIIFLKTLVTEFYQKHQRLLMNLNSEQRANYVFEWVRRNIQYDNSAVGRDWNYLNETPLMRWIYADSIETYKRKKGVCTGRSRLLKVLLNNKYIKVDCFLVEGTVKGPQGDVPHEWNTCIINGQKKYYDLSYNNRGIINIESRGYFDIKLENGIQEKIDSYYPNNGIKKVNLPPRNNSDN